MGGVLDGNLYSVALEGPPRKGKLSMKEEVDSGKRNLLVEKKKTKLPVKLKALTKEGQGEKKKIEKEKRLTRAWNNVRDRGTSGKKNRLGQVLSRKGKSQGRINYALPRRKNSRNGT